MVVSLQVLISANLDVTQHAHLTNSFFFMLSRGYAVPKLGPVNLTIRCHRRLPHVQLSNCPIVSSLHCKVGVAYFRVISRIFDPSEFAAFTNMVAGD
jgi:hypothetical protein